MVYSNVSVECWRREIIPGICDGVIRVVPIEKAYNVERVQKGIAHWDKQNNDMPVLEGASNYGARVCPYGLT